MITRYLRMIIRVIPYVGMTLSILGILLFVPQLPPEPHVQVDIVPADVCIVASAFYAGAGEFGNLANFVEGSVFVYTRHDPIENIELASQIIKGGVCKVVVLRGEVSTTVLKTEIYTASVFALSPWILPVGDLMDSPTRCGTAIYGSSDIGFVKWVSKTMFISHREVPGGYSSVPYAEDTINLLTGDMPANYIPANLLYAVNTLLVIILLLCLSYLIPASRTDDVRLGAPWSLLLYPAAGLVALLGYKVGNLPYGVYGGWYWLVMGATLSAISLMAGLKFDYREAGVGFALSLAIVPFALVVVRWCGVFPYIDRSKLIYGVLLGLVYIPWFVYIAGVIRRIMRYPLSVVAVWPLGISAWLPVSFSAFAPGVLPMWHIFYFGWQMVVGVLIVPLFALPVVRRSGVWGGVLSAMLFGVIVAGVLPPV